MTETDFQALIHRASRHSPLTDEQVERVRGLVESWEAAYPGSTAAGDVFTGLVMIAEGDEESNRQSLVIAGRRIREAASVLKAARAVLRHEMRLAALAGISESEMARRAGVNRLTVRAALGK